MVMWSENQRESATRPHDGASSAVSISMDSSSHRSPIIRKHHCDAASAFPSCCSLVVSLHHRRNVARSSAHVGRQAGEGA